MKKTFVFVALLSAFSLMFAMTASAGSAMDRIMKKGGLVVGTSGAQPPMTATTKKGEIIGLDADISRAMASAMGVKLKFVSVPFAKLLPVYQEFELFITNNYNYPIPRLIGGFSNVQETNL